MTALDVIAYLLVSVSICGLVTLVAYWRRRDKK